MKKILPYIIVILFALVLIAGIFLVKPGKDEVQQSRTTNTVMGGKGSVTPAGTEASTSENYTSGIPLEISQPQPNDITTSPTITVRGKTNPSAEVFVNDLELKADSKGDFTTTLTLDEGENVIVVVVNDLEGNSAEKQILVTYEPGQ